MHHDIDVRVEAPPRRGRTLAPLFAGVAAVSTAMAGASTSSTLFADAAAGPEWSGVPNAAGVVGTALGALGAGVLVARLGSRSVLLVLYGCAVTGALVASTAASVSVLPLLLAGMVLLGLGNGAAQLSRYLAAEPYPADRKGFALSVIVWAGTVGAVVGPQLISPGASVAGWLSLPPLAGPFLVAAAALAVALTAAALLPRRAVATGPERARLTLAVALAAMRQRVVLGPLVAMVCAQVAMVAVMTMTPLQLDHHGHGLTVVGWVLSAHMIGMFALAPLSGRIADRWGGRVAIYSGIGTLALAAITAGSAPTAHASGLPVALFLLGYGWNLVFVGGSSLLSRDLPAGQRLQLQGVVDALVWGSSAVASLVSGWLFGAGGYVLVVAVAGGLALLPTVFLASQPAPRQTKPGTSCSR